MNKSTKAPRTSRTNAQRAADARYTERTRAAHKKKYASITATFTREEQTSIQKAFFDAEVTPSAALRSVAYTLKTDPTARERIKRFYTRQGPEDPEDPEENPAPRA